MSEETQTSPSTTPAPAADRLKPAKVTSVWRNLATLMILLTFCALTVAESAGAAVQPEYFKVFALAVGGEYILEWAAYWRKRGDI